jgi:hypothetical protein
VRRAENFAPIGTVKNVYKMLVSLPEEKRPFRKPRSR